MSDQIELKYSEYSGWVWCILIQGFILLTFSNLIKFYYNNETENWMLIGGFDFILIFLELFIILKYLIPGIREKVAIELNNDGIIDYIRNQEIPWDNISGIRLIYLKSNACVAIDLIDESRVTNKSRSIFQKLNSKLDKTFWGTPVMISTQYVQGKASAIFEVIQTYYQTKLPLTKPATASAGQGG